MELLNGKIVKESIINDLLEKVDKLDRQLGLTVIQVGEDPASDVYIKQKEKMANSLGYSFNHLKYDVNVPEDFLVAKIEELNKDPLIDGILVQMPLPTNLNAKRIQNTISPNKDVDGLTDINMGKLTHNVDALVACTPLGIMEMLKYYDISVQNKNVVIIGRSDLVGKPLFNLMINNNATVTLCHSKTKNLKFYTKNADVLIVAIGKPNFINKDYIKEEAVIIDVGINRINSKLCGDVDFESVKDICSYITPVPGGVGQMTIAELARNVYNAYLLNM